jgi:hypothetical protein
MMPSLGGSLHHLIPREFAFTSAKDFVWDYPQELPLSGPARFDIGALIDLVREMLPTRDRRPHRRHDDRAIRPRQYAGEQCRSLPLEAVRRLFRSRFRGDGWG